MIISVIAYFVLCASLIEGAKFRSDYSYFNMDDFEGWLKFHRIPANWHEARLRCHLEGAMLASPTTIRLRSAMIAMMQTQAKRNAKAGVFIGIHATFSAGDYSSIDGVPLTKIEHRWVDGEPDNCEDKERCLIMTQDGLLADVNCNETFTYLCYKKKEENTYMTQCGINDNGYSLDARTGRCYKFHRVPRVWRMAYKACAAEGGHLVIINSDTEAQVIKDIFAENPASTMLGNFRKEFAYVGFQDWGEHGDILTIHGETLSQAGYSKFAKDEPNNLITAEFCGSVTREGLYNDILCEAYRAFICEKSTDEPFEEKILSVDKVIF